MRVGGYLRVMVINYADDSPTKDVCVCVHMCVKKEIHSDCLNI